MKSTFSIWHAKKGSFVRTNSGPYALYAGNGLGLIKVVKCSPQEELKDFQAVPDLELSVYIITSETSSFRATSYFHHQAQGLTFLPAVFSDERDFGHKHGADFSYGVFLNLPVTM